MQVISPLGEPLALPLELASGVQGGEMLHQAAAGVVLVVEGALRQRTSIDGRYARDAQDVGQEVRTLKLQAQLVRGVRADEPLTSAVWLEGQVAEPPRLMRHSQDRNVQLAMITLNVLTHHAAPTLAGHCFTLHQYMAVQVGIPVEASDAPLLYRVGNVVRVEGQLDSMLFTQGGERVQQTLAKLHAAFQAQLAETRNEIQRRDALRRYRRERMQLEMAARPFVLIGFVEPSKGTDGVVLAEPLDLATALVQRRAFVAELRRRWAARGVAPTQKT